MGIIYSGVKKGKKKLLKIVKIAREELIKGTK
jgi:hypothetical protein